MLTTTNKVLNKKLNKMSKINCHGTEEHYGEVIPDWFLVRLVNKKTTEPYYIESGFEMDEGSWGLTYWNNPDFVFDMNPMQEVNVDSDLYSLYRKTINHYHSRLTGEVYPSYLLIKGLKESGWNIGCGTWLTEYLCNKMWETLEQCNWKPFR